MKKIIIFRTDRLGDFIINSRPIYELKNKFKDVKLTIVCSEINKKIISKFNFIDEVITYDKKYNFLQKIKIFFNIIKNSYYTSFVMDGKNFSFLCNAFLRSKYKLGISYKSVKKILNVSLNFYRPSLIYRFFFLDKFEIFTSKKDLVTIEPLVEKYINIFKDFNNKISAKDKYIFVNSNDNENKFSKISKNLNLKKFILIHLDEKWLDINNIEKELWLEIVKLQKKIDYKVLLTAFNNNFSYFHKIKKKFTYYNFNNLNFGFYNNSANSNIIILDNIEIFLFERFLNHSKINISCHSGFVVQVCGANGGNLIDIINENDYIWYSCWKPQNTFHKFIYKSLNKKKLFLNTIFNNIANEILKI